MARPGISTKNTEKIPPGPKFWTPRIYPQNTPKIPKKYPQNTKNDRFWYFFGIFGVFSWGSKISAWGLFFRYFLWKFRVGPSRGSVAGVLLMGLSTRSACGLTCNTGLAVDSGDCELDINMFRFPPPPPLRFPLLPPFFPTLLLPSSPPPLSSPCSPLLSPFFHPFFPLLSPVFPPPFSHDFPPTSPHLFLSLPPFPATCATSPSPSLSLSLSLALSLSLPLFFFFLSPAE